MYFSDTHRKISLLVRSQRVKYALCSLCLTQDQVYCFNDVKDMKEPFSSAEQTLYITADTKELKNKTSKLYKSRFSKETKVIEQIWCVLEQLTDLVSLC